MSPVADLPPQACPACGTLVDVAEAEPLASVVCPSCGDAFRVERAFDHFVLIETLGTGGMGAVYKARDTRLDRLVALKVLRKELSADPAEAARLEQEARVLAAVNHPSVVQVYSSGSAHNQIYLVMELVAHGSLDDLIGQQRRIPEAQVLQTGIQVAKGLQAAHEKGLVHRDVKPANILFANPETAKIGDFGLAVAAGENAETGMEIWGTPYYVAPERLNNEPEDFRSDIYSLGATLFHALAGRPPIEGETTSAAELRELKNHPPDLRAIVPEISRPSARLIDRMLAPNPADRFASYRELLDQLQQAAGQTDRTGSKRKMASALAFIGALALVAVAALYFIQKQEPQSVATSAPSPTSTPDNSVVRASEAEAREKINRAALAAARKSAEEKAREAERKQLFDQESPGWEKALGESRAKIAVYDFASALAIIDAVKVSEPSLLEAQVAERKRLEWLAEWKSQLLADLNSGRFKSPVQLGAATYQGATKADDARITFRLPPYGTADIEWVKIPPAVLLAMSTSLIPSSGSATADRQWLCAVFAYFGQAVAARPLAEAAAKAKPEYAAQLKLFAPAKP